MKKAFTWLWDKIKWVFGMIPTYLLIGITIAVIVSIITQNIVYGFFALFGLILLLTIFVFGRQLYWWLTSKGDYENNDKKE